MRFLLIDRQHLVRTGVAEIIRLGFRGAEVVETGSETEAVDWLRRAERVDIKPDVILIDPFLPGAGRGEKIRKISASAPGRPIVVLSASSEVEVAHEAIGYGAAGYVSKAAHSKALFDTIKIVVDGGIHVPPLAPAASVPAATDPSADSHQAFSHLGLTLRQSEVLALMMRGYTNKMICRSLNIELGTCKAHIGAILRAMGASNRREAGIRAKFAVLKQ